MPSLLEARFERYLAQREKARFSQHSHTCDDVAPSEPAHFNGNEEALLVSIASDTPSLRCLRVSSALVRATLPKMKPTVSSSSSALARSATSHATSSQPASDMAMPTVAARRGFSAPLGEALLLNRTIRSLEITRDGYLALQALATDDAKNTGVYDSADQCIHDDAWTNVMLSCYQLPLRTLQLSGLRLNPEKVEQVLRLVAHLSGTERGHDRARPHPPPSSRTGAAATAAMPMHRDGSTSSAGTLEFLDLSDNKLTPIAASMLHAILYHPHCTLRRVCLNGCELTDVGAARLFAPLEQAVPELVAGPAQTVANSHEKHATPPVKVLSPRLEVLELRWNGLTEASEAAMQLAYVSARVLSAHPRTTSISIPNNASTTQGNNNNNTMTAAARAHTATPAPYARTTPLVMHVDGNALSAPAYHLLSAPATTEDLLRRRSSRDASSRAAGGTRQPRPVGGAPLSGASSFGAGASGAIATTATAANEKNTRTGPSPVMPEGAPLRRIAIGSAESSLSSNGYGFGGEHRPLWRHAFVNTSPLRQRIAPPAPAAHQNYNSNTDANRKSATAIMGGAAASGLASVRKVSTVTSIGAAGSPTVSVFGHQNTVSRRDGHGLSSPRSAVSTWAAGGGGPSVAAATSHGVSFAFSRMVHDVDRLCGSSGEASSMPPHVSGDGADDVSAVSASAAVASLSMQTRHAAATASTEGGLSSVKKLALRRARRAASRSKTAGTAAAATAAEKGYNFSDDDGDDEEDDALTGLAAFLLTHGGCGGGDDQHHEGFTVPRGALQQFPALHVVSDLLQRHAYWQSYFRGKQQQAAHNTAKRERVRAQGEASSAQLMKDAMRQASPEALAARRAVVQLVAALTDDAAASDSGTGVSTTGERHDPFHNLRAVAALMGKASTSSV